MDMTTLITQMLVLTIVMAIGFLARRTQVMDAGFSRQLSGLLLRIAQRVRNAFRHIVAVSSAGKIQNHIKIPSQWSISC